MQYKQADADQSNDSAKATYDDIEVANVADVMRAIANDATIEQVSLVINTSVFTDITNSFKALQQKVEELTKTSTNNNNNNNTCKWNANNTSYYWTHSRIRNNCYTVESYIHKNKVTTIMQYL